MPDETSDNPETHVVSEDQATWRSLPNELQALVIGNLDVQGSVCLKQCARHEANLIRKHSKHVVNIIVMYYEDPFLENPAETSYFYIALKNEGSNRVQLTWRVYACELRHSEVQYTYTNNSEVHSVIVKESTMLSTTSKILQNLLTEPMFIVKRLEVELQRCSGLLDFGSVVAYLDGLVVRNCFCLRPIQHIITNKNVRFRGIVFIGGATQIFTNFQRWKYSSIITSVPFIESIWYQYITTFEDENIDSFQKALELVQFFVSSSPPFNSIMDEDYNKTKLESTKTINVLMYFRAAYFYNIEEPVPYLREIDRDFEINVAFLKYEVDHFCLNECQLATLSIVYIARLLRNDHMVQSIYDRLYDCLWLVLEEYKVLNYYEKFVKKLEMLLPDEKP